MSKPKLELNVDSIDLGKGIVGAPSGLGKGIVGAPSGLGKGIGRLG